jgi:hypothetical protein
MPVLTIMVRNVKDRPAKLQVGIGKGDEVERGAPP